MAQLTSSNSAPSRLRLSTWTRSRNDRPLVSIPHTVAFNVIGTRGWRRHPINFECPLFQIWQLRSSKTGDGVSGGNPFVITEVIASVCTAYSSALRKSMCAAIAALRQGKDFRRYRAPKVKLHALRGKGMDQRGLELAKSIECSPV